MSRGLAWRDKRRIYFGTKAALIGCAGASDRVRRPKDVLVSAVCPAAVDTEFAIGSGPTAGHPWPKEVLRPEYAAHAIVTILEQPLQMRTTQWTNWAVGHGRAGLSIGPYRANSEEEY